MLTDRSSASRVVWSILSASMAAGFDVSCSSLESGSDWFGAAGADGLALNNQVSNASGGGPSTDAGASSGGRETSSNRYDSGGAARGGAERDPEVAGRSAIGDGSGGVDSAGAAGAEPVGAAGSNSTCWAAQDRASACFRCLPTNIVEFERACTTSTCVPFDNDKRLPKLVSGRLPNLPETYDNGTGGATSTRPSSNDAGRGG
ncbi:MAG TPA: hypothetical protein VIV60_12205, partial [Polyangiaceae bacterium]